jgi:hypothetical protein
VKLFQHFNFKNLLLMDLGRITGGDIHEMEVVNKTAGRKGVFIFMALDAGRYPFPIIVALVVLACLYPEVRSTIAGLWPVLTPLVLAYFTMVTAITVKGHSANVEEHKIDGKTSVPTAAVQDPEAGK